MNRDDLQTYWNPAAEHLLNLGLMRPGRKHYHDELDRMLGVTIFNDYMYRDYKDDFPLSNDMKNLLRGLAGPYAEIILKVYLIRKGGNRDRE
jgi:hypothetical protein